MVDLIHSILYPFASLKNTKRTLVLGILNIFWYLLVPVVFINGYIVKMIRNTIEGNEEMPKWPGLSLSEWWYLIKHGFIFTLIMFIYLAIPFAIAYFGTAVKPSLLIILISILIFLLMAFMLPMALVSYAATESIVQAFNLPEIFTSIIKNIGNYLLVGLISFIILMAVLFVAPYIPYVAGFFLVLPSLVAMHGFAQVLAKAQ